MRVAPKSWSEYTTCCELGFHVLILLFYVLLNHCVLFFLSFTFCKDESHALRCAPNFMKLTPDHVFYLFRNCSFINKC